MLLGREDEDPTIVVEVFLRYREDAGIEISFCMDGVESACICLYRLKDEFINVEQGEHCDIMVEEEEMLIVQAWIAGESFSHSSNGPRVMPSVQPSIMGRRDPDEVELLRFDKFGSFHQNSGCVFPVLDSIWLTVVREDHQYIRLAASFIVKLRSQEVNEIFPLDSLRPSSSKSR